MMLYKIKITRVRKIMTMKTYLLLVIISLTILSGCSGGFLRANPEQMVSYNFRSGTEGLRLEFIEGMPPRQLFIGTEFSTGVKVKNMGAYDLGQDSSITLSVPDMSAFRFQGGNVMPVQLRGKSLYLKEGEEDVLIFPMKALCFPGYTGTRDSIVKNYTRKIKASACYYYETVADADICVDTRKFLRQPHDKPECVMADSIMSGGQGGPVGLVRISPAIIPASSEETTVQLSISLDKLQGMDHTIFSEYNRGCDIIPQDNQQNMVGIEVTMGGKMVECEPSTVKLKEKSSVSAVCKTTIQSAQGAYVTPVTVTMKYYVQQNILRDMTVEPPPGQQDLNCAAISAGGNLR